MRAIFLGTPPEAIPSLDALLEVAEVPLVVTQPDRPRGRSGTPQAPEVKTAAVERGLEVTQPADAADLLQTVRAVGPDVALVTAYGRLIGPELLAVPEAGFVNVHFSLLPRWRGASPVVRAILAGDREAGVSLMKMDEGLDTGPVIARDPTSILPEESAGELTARLAELGAGLVRQVLGDFVDGSLEAVAQEDAQATAAGKVTTEEAHIDPTRHGRGAVERAVRAFDPRPGAWAMLDGERFKFWRVRIAEGHLEPGLVATTDGRVLMGCRDGPVELLEVQPAGKPRMDADVWMRGRRDQPARVTG